MTSINTALFESLQTVESPGDYYAHGKLDIFLPQLDVEGVGRIALPLLPMQMQQLVAFAERAPFGKGTQTLVDTDVRRTWQIDAGRVKVGGKHWPDNLGTIVKRCAHGLGVGGDVHAELYKLLVYDTGSFFVSHRDTEKSPGMFATLVIVLPSQYQGGELVIRHKQQEATLDLHAEDSSEVGYAAFYADCLHEILPITEGCRLTLVYNLLRTDKKLPLPMPPDYHQEQSTVAALLRHWTGDLAAQVEGVPEKLIYLLQHAYTEAEVGFDALKNGDAAIADVLIAACQEADCELHLALVSIDESCDAEYSGYSRQGGYGGEEYEAGEVLNREESISNWRRPDGTTSPLADLPLKENEFCPPEAFDDIEFDDEEFQEYTGNAGATFERSYRHAAFVLWPKSYYLAIVNQAGASAALSALGDLCQRWEAEGKDPASKLWQDAHTLAGYILRDNLSNDISDRYVMKGSCMRPFLGYSYRLNNIQHISLVWSKLVETGFHNKDDSTAVVQAAELLPWPEVACGVEKMVALSAAKDQEACAALLARFCKAKPESARDLLTPVYTLFSALPGDPSRFPDLLPWQRARLTVNTDLVVDVLRSFSAVDATMADNALTYILAWPALYKMDGILLPAALLLIEASSSRHLPAVIRLRDAVTAHLQARVALELQPPADWRRDNQLSCKCADCAELKQFLANAEQEQWVFKAAEARRTHLQGVISQHKCDVDCKTQKGGTPYRLICTKNQASYQRRVEQRAQDVQLLAKLAL
jgi:predicted 2-oxoglutarate/Fe(II)-dependent dioxygenase YbiX